jgi:hypothetical protein
MAVRSQRKVNAQIGHQVSLELTQVDVERALEAERGRYGAHYLSDQSVQVNMRGSIDT